MSTNQEDKWMLLLGQAGDARRAEEQRDAGWRALTDGDLDERALAALRAQAERSGEEHLEELYRPFDDLEQQRMIAAIRAQRDRERSAARRRWLRRKAPWATGLLVPAAAAAALLVRSPSPVAYNEFEIDRSRNAGDESVWRSKDLGDELTLRLVKVKSAQSKTDPEVRFVCEQGVRRLLCALRAAVMKEGDLLISGRRDVMLPGEVEGQWDLSIVVGAPGKGPKPNELVKRGAGPSGGYDGYQVLKVRLVLEKPLPPTNPL